MPKALRCADCMSNAERASGREHGNVISAYPSWGKRIGQLVLNVLHAFRRHPCFIRISSQSPCRVTLSERTTTTKGTPHSQPAEIQSSRTQSDRWQETGRGRTTRVTGGYLLTAATVRRVAAQLAWCDDRFGLILFREQRGD